MKIDRTFLDEVLRQTEARGDMEKQIMASLGHEDYFKMDDKDKENLRRMTDFILGRDMMIIKLAAKHTLKKIKEDK